MNEPTLAILWDVDRTMLDAGPLTRDVLAETIAAVLPGAPADAGPLITGGTDTQVLRDLATALAPTRTRRCPRWSKFAARTRASAQQMRAEGRLMPGVRELVHHLHRAGAVQTVLTGNIRANAELKLTTFGLADSLQLDLGAYGDEHPDRRVLPSRARDRIRQQHGTDVSLWVVGDTPWPPPAPPACAACWSPPACTDWRNWPR